MGLHSCDRLAACGGRGFDWLCSWRLCSASRWGACKDQGWQLASRFCIYRGLLLCHFRLMFATFHESSVFLLTVRSSFVDALKNWRANLRKSRGGDDTSESAVKLWQAKRAQIEKDKKESEKEDPEQGKAKKLKIDAEGEDEVAKLNRSPTKVLLLTNFAAASENEQDIREKAEKLVASFGKVEQCQVLKVPNVPDEDAVRVFLLFESVQVSSKAYAAVKGQAGPLVCILRWMATQGSKLSRHPWVVKICSFCQHVKWNWTISFVPLCCALCSASRFSMVVPFVHASMMSVASVKAISRSSTDSTKKSDNLFPWGCTFAAKRLKKPRNPKLQREGKPLICLQGSLYRVELFCSLGW